MNISTIFSRQTILSFLGFRRGLEKYFNGSNFYEQLSKEVQSGALFFSRNTFFKTALYSEIALPRLHKHTFLRVPKHFPQQADFRIISLAFELPSQ